MVNVPELRDELERKTLETYEWIIEQASSGQMSEPEVKTSMQAVFGVTAGLVSREITEAAETVEANAHSNFTHRRVFYSTVRSYVVSWTVGSDTVHCTGFGPTAEKRTQAYKRDSAREALQMYTHLCNQILERTGEEVL